MSLSVTGLDDRPGSQSPDDNERVRGSGTRPVFSRPCVDRPCSALSESRVAFHLLVLLRMTVES